MGRLNKSVPFDHSVKSVDGVSYYMTRDPYVGPRGVQQGLLDGAMSTGVNAIVIGK